jgi:hypothetical protein
MLLLIYYSTNKYAVIQDVSYVQTKGYFPSTTESLAVSMKQTGRPE